MHVSKTSLCRQYDAERLDTTFEFTPGWVTYSGPLAECREPQISVLKTAKDMRQSIISGSSGNFQFCSHTTGLGDASPTRTGVGIGHLSADKALSKHDLGFAHAIVTDSGVDVAFAFYQKGAFQPPRHDRTNDGSGVRPKK